MSILINMKTRYACYDNVMTNENYLSSQIGHNALPT